MARLQGRLALRAQTKDLAGHPIRLVHANVGLESAGELLRLGVTAPLQTYTANDCRFDRRIDLDASYLTGAVNAQQAYHAQETKNEDDQFGDRAHIFIGCIQNVRGHPL